MKTSFSPVGTSSILDIADAKDLSNEKESNKLFWTDRKFLNVKNKMTLMLTTLSAISHNSAQNVEKSRKC